MINSGMATRPRPGGHVQACPCYKDKFVLNLKSNRQIALHETKHHVYSTIHKQANL